MLTDYTPSALDALGRTRRFPTATEDAFSAHDKEYATAQYVYKPIGDELLALIMAKDGNLACSGRLTLETGVPASASDQTSKTTIYFTPLRGNVIMLYSGTNWVAYPFAEISKALGTLTSGKNYDVFAYAATGNITGATNATPIVITSASHGLANGDLVVINGVGGNDYANGARKVANVTTNTFELQDLNGNNVAGNAAYTSGGTWSKVALEFSAAWTSDTARNDAVSLQDGVYVKSSAKTRRYLGTFRTTSTTTTEDSLTKRFVWNLYNQVQRPLLRQDTTDTWTYATTSWRAANNDATNNAVRAVTGIQGQNFASIHVSARLIAEQAEAGGVGIGLNSSTANSAQTWDDLTFSLGAGSGAVGTQNKATLNHYPAIGLTEWFWIEYARAGTITFAGDQGLVTVQSGIGGWVMG